MTAVARIRRTWERVRNVPGLGRDAVALAVLVALGLACTGYIFSQYDIKPPWQSGRVVFAAEFEKTPGVRPESRNEVRIAGVTVGKIESAEPLPNGNARLVMSLDPGHTVYSNAKAVLSTKAPLNVMFVSLDPGGPPGTPLPANGTIPVSQTKRVIQPSELLSKLDERTRDALQTLLDEADTALANAPAQLPDGLRATDATVNAFRPVVEQLQTRRGTISKLVTSLSQISAAAGHDDGRLADLVASLQQTLSVLSQRDTELSGTLSQIPGFSDDLTHAMGSVRDLTGELNPTLDGLQSASTTLPPALSRVTGMVDRAGPLVAAAKPVVSEAKPVVADLRPLAGDVHTAFRQLAPVTGYLPSATARIVPWMGDLAAFVYQTSSAFSMADANGGLGRANLTLSLDNPTGGLGPADGGPVGGGK